MFRAARQIYPLRQHVLLTHKLSKQVVDIVGHLAHVVFSSSHFYSRNQIKGRTGISLCGTVHRFEFAGLYCQCHFIMSLGTALVCFFSGPKMHKTSLVIESDYQKQVSSYFIAFAGGKFKPFPSAWGQAESIPNRCVTVSRLFLTPFEQMFFSSILYPPGNARIYLYK